MVSISTGLRTAAVAAILGIAGGIGGVPLPAIGVTDPPTTGPRNALPVDPDGIPSEARNDYLGTAWPTSDDTTHLVLGGSDGLSVLTAAASDGYAWHELTALPTYEASADLWISNSCVTSSGRYMAIVYAPRTVTNSENGFGGGANAVILDLGTGGIRDLGTGFSIAYFDPGCGAGDTVTFTRVDPETSATQLGTLDADTGKVRNRFEVAGQATSAVADAAGTIYAVTAKGIIAQTVKGATSTVAAPAGTVYDLSTDDRGRVGYVVKDGTESASAYILDRTGKASPQQIARGGLNELGLRASQLGGFYLLGAGLRADIGAVDGVRQLPEANPSSIISSTGALIVQSVLPSGVATAADAEASDSTIQNARIQAVVPDTGKTLDFDLGNLTPTAATGGGAPTDSPFVGGNTARRTVTSTTSSLSIAAISAAGPAVMTGDPHNPVEAERACSVPRNDPASQAFQPKPRQVEWAVDRAVKGQLTETRPSNWRGLGIGGYAASTEFPPVALTGGGTIPPQIVLGVLMQESNLWQADKYTQPGDTGNPLIGNFYGNSASALWTINYAQADCGYGVGQITDGMRLAGQERPGETALPYAKQREIALDYEANVAMAVRMLGQKWNELAAAGITVNNANPAKIENWFATVWDYNTGLQPTVQYGNTTGCTPSATCTGPDGTWGLGWFNNPANPTYPPSRAPFLQDNHAADAAAPQNWPYPEKVMGWAAWGATLVQSQSADVSTRTYPSVVVSSYNLAWWGESTSDGVSPEQNRMKVKPYIDTFCTSAGNDCTWTASSPCALASQQCWWHSPATWKSNCNQSCGYGTERFSWPTYNTEVSSTTTAYGAPSSVLLTSFPPNCAAPPTGFAVVDDTTQTPVRNTECSRQSTTGSFQFTFASADANGNYPAKIDLHQGGGGFDGHFFFAHMQLGTSADQKITGTWSLGADRTGNWVRVWVHLPDHAGWTQQAAYTIGFGNGTFETRYLPQRWYANQWVSLGVFQMQGIPTVSLSNVITHDLNPQLQTSGHSTVAAVDDVAWDSVAFQTLTAKPEDFVVALGDSYSSGEGAGDYAAWSDNNGSSPWLRNACHQSANSWIRDTVMPGDTQSIGARADSPGDATLDFHMTACSGAETEELLPFATVSGAPPANALDETGEWGRWGMVSQLDAGYLDANTTLVTLSIGGNDMQFAPILSACVGTVAGTDEYSQDCSHAILPIDSTGIIDASADRLATQLPGSLATVLAEIRSRAPSARIALVGYPKLFETGSECVGISTANKNWLNDFTDDLSSTMAAAAASANSAAPSVFFVDPQTTFSGHNLCVPAGSGINGLMWIPTPGEDPLFGVFGEEFLASGSFATQETIHPNTIGTQLYADALEMALAAHP